MVVRRIAFSQITIALIVLCLLGSQIAYLDIGIGRLSGYRALTLLAPLIVFPMYGNALIRHRVMEKYDYVAFLALFVSYALLSGVWTINHSIWMRELTFIVPGFLTSLLIFAYLNDKQSYRRALMSVIVISAGFACLGIFEIVTGQYFFEAEDSAAVYSLVGQADSILGIRIPVTVFGNTNNFALFMFFSFVFARILKHTSLNRAAQVLYSLLSTVFGFLIFSTQSRSALFSLLIYSVITLYLWFRRKKMATQISYALALTAISVMIAGLIGETLVSLAQMYSIDWAGVEGQSDTVRRNLILSGFAILQQSWLLGAGLGNIGEYLVAQNRYDTQGILVMHNWWIEILASCGVIVFSVYVLVYLHSLWCALWNMKRSKNVIEKDVNAGLLAFFAAFVIGSVGPSSLIQTEWIWPLLAMCHLGLRVFSDEASRLAYNGTVAGASGGIAADPRTI